MLTKFGDRDEIHLRRIREGTLQTISIDTFDRRRPETQDIDQFLDRQTKDLRDARL